MSATSTAPACKQAILTILGTVPDLATVDQRWAPPTEETDVSDEMLWLGDTEIVDDNWAALGNGRRRETYRVAVTVWVRNWGDDPQTVEQRAWAIWADVANALRTDIRAAPSTLRSAGVRQFDQITATQTNGVAGPQQWGARIDARITFIAELP